MNKLNATLDFIAWQQMVSQAEELALRMPELGLKPDCFSYQHIDNLAGILAFLKRKDAEKYQVE